MGSEHLPEDWTDNEQEPITVCVVAPALVLRTGLRHLLSDIPDVDMVWESDTLVGLEDITPSPDILVVAKGSSTGEELSEALESLSSGAILLLVEDDSEIDIQLADFYGRAWGILSINASAEELGAAIQALSAGLLVGMPALFDPILLDIPADIGDQVHEPLTDRESEVLQLLAQGLANKQIALQLGISEHTVKFHVSGIYAKLGATNRTEAVRLGVRRGLILL
jgi:DNA-binding NarL/FixJ family response regulator